VRGAKVSEGVRESFWLQGMMAGFPAAYFCIKAFSETDQTEDLKKIDVPTLIIQGDDDQIVPFAAAGQLQAKLVKGATLKVYKGAPPPLPKRARSFARNTCSGTGWGSARSSPLRGSGR
jgi:non-heme chloroperoxidase